MGVSLIGENRPMRGYSEKNCDPRTTHEDRLEQHSTLCTKHVVTDTLRSVALARASCGSASRLVTSRTSGRRILAVDVSVGGRFRLCVAWLP